MAFSVNSCLLSCEALAAIVTFEQLRSWAAYEVNPSWRVMHQSIPAAPSPLGYCGVFARPVSPGGGAFANFALPRRQAFANP